MTDVVAPANDATTTTTPDVDPPTALKRARSPDKEEEAETTTKEQPAAKRPRTLAPRVLIKSSGDVEVSVWNPETCADATVREAVDSALRNRNLTVLKALEEGKLEDGEEKYIPDMLQRTPVAEWGKLNVGDEDVYVVNFYDV